MRSIRIIALLIFLLASLAKADVKIDAIADDWRSTNGVWITITEDGALLLKDIDENVLYEGTIKLLSYQNAGFVVSTFIIEVDFGEIEGGVFTGHATSVIPGAFYSGEGDPARLKLFLIDNDFGWILNKYFNIKTDDVLLLYSKDHQDRWPDWIDEQTCPTGLKQIKQQKDEVWCSVDVDTESRMVLWSEEMLDVRNLRIEGCIDEAVAEVIANLSTLKNIEKIDMSGPGCVGFDVEKLIASSKVLISMNEILVGDEVIKDALVENQGYSRKSNAEIETIAEQLLASESIEIVVYPRCGWAGCSEKSEIYGFMSSELFFQSDQLSISDDNWNALSYVAQIVNDMGLKVKFQGSVDESAINGLGSMTTWELSAIQAAKVADMFIANGGVDPNCITVEGNGHYNPICDVSFDDSNECRRKNNVIEILLEPTPMTPLRDWNALIGYIKKKH